MFMNLYEALNGLEAPHTNGRLCEALDRGLPPVSIVGIGGFPILGKEGAFTLLGAPISPERLRSGLIEALGQSAILTYLNPKHRSLEEMGERCLKDGHTWALHALPITLCFAGHPAFVEMSFNRDGSFMQGGSWVEAPVIDATNGRIFTMHGSIKAWKRYLGYRNDPGFMKPQREALSQAWEVMNWLLPDIFKEA